MRRAPEARQGKGRLILTVGMCLGAVVVAGLIAKGANMPAAPEVIPTAGAPLQSHPRAIDKTLSAAYTTEQLLAFQRSEARAKLPDFLQSLWPDAATRGVLRDLFDRAFAGIEPDDEIFDLLVNQPEHVAAPWDYLNRLVNDTRIAKGRELLAEHATLLAALEMSYGVDRHILLAIWGIEFELRSSAGQSWRDPVVDDPGDRRHASAKILA